MGRGAAKFTEADIRRAMKVAKERGGWLNIPGTFGTIITGQIALKGGSITAVKEQ